jgi:predicted cupin superfamily sugar epimerase
MELLELLPDGTSRKVILGGDILAGQKVQYVVKSGIWQGSRLVDGGEYALMGTTMSPGFEESDYEHADAGELIKKYPQEEEMIRRLTGETKFY